MSAQGPIDRTPGRLVVCALICMYAGFFLLFLGFAVGEWSTGGQFALMLSHLSSLACPLLIVSAIAMRLSAPR